MTAAEHMKQGFVRIKDQDSQTQTENQGSSESVAYAQDHISRTTESLAYHGSRRVIHQGERFGRIGRDRISRGVLSMKNRDSQQKPVRRQAQNARSIVQQSVKIRKRNTKAVKSLQKTASSIKSGSTKGEKQEEEL